MPDHLSPDPNSPRCEAELLALDAWAFEWLRQRGAPDARAKLAGIAGASLAEWASFHFSLGIHANTAAVLLGCGIFSAAALIPDAWNSSQSRGSHLHSRLARFAMQTLRNAGARCLPDPRCLLTAVGRTLSSLARAVRLPAPLSCPLLTWTELRELRAFEDFIPRTLGAEPYATLAFAWLSDALLIDAGDDFDDDGRPAVFGPRLMAVRSKWIRPLRNYARQRFHDPRDEPLSAAPEASSPLWRRPSPNLPSALDLMDRVTSSRRTMFLPELMQRRKSFLDMRSRCEAALLAETCDAALARPRASQRI